MAFRGSRCRSWGVVHGAIGGAEAKVRGSPVTPDAGSGFMRHSVGLVERDGAFEVLVRLVEHAEPPELLRGVAMRIRRGSGSDREQRGSEPPVGRFQRDRQRATWGGALSRRPLGLPGSSGLPERAAPAITTCGPSPVQSKMNGDWASSSITPKLGRKADAAEALRATATRPPALRSWLSMWPFRKVQSWPVNSKIHSPLTFMLRSLSVLAA